jgi:hypothetical protein
MTLLPASIEVDGTGLEVSPYVMFTKDRNSRPFRGVPMAELEVIKEGKLRHG